MPHPYCSQHEHQAYDRSGNPPSLLEDVHTRDETGGGELSEDKYHID